MSCRTSWRALVSLIASILTSRPATQAPRIGFHSLRPRFSRTLRSATVANSSPSDTQLAINLRRMPPSHRPLQRSSTPRVPGAFSKLIRRQASGHVFTVDCFDAGSTASLLNFDELPLKIIFIVDYRCRLHWSSKEQL